MRIVCGRPGSPEIRSAESEDRSGRDEMSWRIRGTYFESCNCDAICPCRRIDGVAGGRSTHGVCTGVLSWLIEGGGGGPRQGGCGGLLWWLIEGGGGDGIALAGVPVALGSRYSDDEPGSPW